MMRVIDLPVPHREATGKGKAELVQQGMGE